MHENEKYPTKIDIYGLNLGCKKGWFVWPIPACNVKFHEDKTLGYSEQRPKEEAHKICLEYCKLIDNKLPDTLKNRLHTMNKKIKESQTCVEMCDNVLEYLTPDVEEKFSYPSNEQKCGKLSVWFIVLFIVIALVIVTSLTVNKS